MYLLILGLALFIIPHIMLAIAPGICNKLKAKLSDKTVKLIFTLSIITSIILMVLGYRSILPNELYQPLDILKIPAIILIIISFILFVAAKSQNNFKRFLRHPQLSSIALWSLSHLILFSDERAVILFGSFFVWSILEMILINKRDGARKIPAKTLLKADLLSILVGTVIFVIILLLHPYIFGVSAFPNI